ncbi:MAG: TetR/AcrR family transcriptional regulator [bacterium]|nr:TetR/AcrR family transcriptional regulator [bacterium]
MATPDPFASADSTTTALVEGAISLLADQGPGALSVRKVASHAGLTTMAVYSRFGNKAALLNAVYRRGFELLAETMNAADNADPLNRLRGLVEAYRRFAVDNPALYSLMFEHLVGFDPPDQLRTETTQATLGIVVDTAQQAIKQGLLVDIDPINAAYIIWATTHGAISLSLVHTARSPRPGSFLDTEQAANTFLHHALDTTLRGLTP